MAEDKTVNTWHWLLGVLGLIPFVGLSTAMWLNINPQHWQVMLSAYAFGIGSFLTGSWWREGQGQAALIASNGLFLALLFSFIGLTEQFLIIAAVLLVVIYWLEQHTTMIAGASVAYRKLRLLLTAVAAVSLIAAQLAITFSSSPVQTVQP